MNKNTRYEIRLSVQLKNEFVSCGGNAEIVRTFMEDFIVRTNNDMMANENSNAIWNLSVPNKTVSGHTYEIGKFQTRKDKTTYCVFIDGKDYKPYSVDKNNVIQRFKSANPNVDLIDRETKEVY